MARFLVACLASTLCWLVTRAAPTHAALADPPPPAPATPNDKIAGQLALTPEQLLQSLSHADWHERRDAVHQLITQGPEADAMLRDLLRRNLDNEQRKNVGLVASVAVTDAPPARFRTLDRR